MDSLKPDGELVKSSLTFFAGQLRCSDQQFPPPSKDWESPKNFPEGFMVIIAGSRRSREKRKRIRLVPARRVVSKVRASAFRTDWDGHSGLTRAGFVFPCHSEEAQPPGNLQDRPTAADMAGQWP